MRFYNIDGQELDVSDPKFFIDEELYEEIQESVSEMINDYL
jgi:hypothetical protein